MIAKATAGASEVTMGTREAARASGAAEKSTWIVFVDNMRNLAFRSVLRELFEFHGKVTRVFIPCVNWKTKFKFSTFAFVSFVNPTDMKRVIANVNKSYIDGRMVSVSKARTGLKRNMHFSGRDYWSYKESLLDFFIPVNESAWMKQCMVGFIKQVYYIDWVQKALVNEGIWVKVVTCGSKSESTILIFDSVIELERVWNNNRDVVSFRFNHLVPLLLEDGCPYYLCQGGGHKSINQFDSLDENTNLSLEPFVHEPAQRMPARIQIFPFPKEFIRNVNSRIPSIEKELVSKTTLEGQDKVNDILDVHGTIDCSPKPYGLHDNIALPKLKPDGNVDGVEPLGDLGLVFVTHSYRSPR
ncbi:hypothetical protein V6N13_113841 [Hibiscus sabdariffa]|uniref:RRM domain-containing protein n=1 Tax=Hibiscus sabdariffa TaxID=183260 RepID=A0ABR2U0B8_9ROSI